MLNKAATAAGIGHIHPHQLRHTLATHAINRGMSLEAIAALLGHHSMDMTLRYAKPSGIAAAGRKTAGRLQGTASEWASRAGQVRR